MSRPAARTARATILSLVVGLVATFSVGSLTAPAHAENVVTPGDFTGYGFDQCLGPTQSAMNRWLTHSPFLSVGIYISGDSRACRSQPNLTPRWISTQLRKGWRLLPITLVLIIALMCVGFFAAIFGCLIYELNVGFPRYFCWERLLPD